MHLILIGPLMDSVSLTTYEYIQPLTQYGWISLRVEKSKSGPSPQGW